MRDPSGFRDRFRLYKEGKSVNEIYDGGYIKEPVITPDKQYNEYINSLPDNLRLTPESSYRSHRYWELNGKPKNFSLAIQKGMFTMQPDGWHANSVAENINTGELEFMKPWNHPTVKKEYDWFKSEEASDFRKRYKLVGTVPYDKYIPKYKEGKMPYENGLPKYEDGTSNIIQYNEDTRDLSEYGEDTADRLLYYVRDPLTVSKNVIQSILHPKGVVERIMRQGFGGVRSVNDVVKGIFLNKGGDYTGYIPGLNSTESSYDRDLIGLYLYGNDKGFQKINASDNIGHSYDKEIISSGRDPKNISTYYGRFPVNKEIILPKYAEKNVKALIDSGINTTIPLHSFPNKGFDDVARFLATVSMKNNKPVVSYSDMWDFMPELYNLEYCSNFFENIQSYIADKSGTPFILRQNVPIKFDDAQYDINDQGGYYTVIGKQHNLADEILLRSGIIPEIVVLPPKKPSKRKIRLRQNK